MRKTTRLLVIGLVSLALSACTFSDPRIEGTPAPPPINAAFVAELGAAAEEIGTAWEIVAAISSSQGDSARWLALSGALEAYWLVLTGPDPLNRRSAINSEVDPEPRLGTIGEAESALEEARDQNLARAEQSTGLTAGFWASLACGIEQVRRGLRSNYDSPIPANPSNTLVLLTADQALANLILRYHEGIFGLQAALGFLSDYSEDWEVIARVLATLQADLDALNSLTATPPAFPGAYELPAGRDGATARAMLAATQQSLVQAAAVWVASAEDPSEAIGYLMSNATLTSSLSIGLAHWPGWPD
ncbi:MAG: hypothetical protein LBE83_05740 [Propionibacteriaceae bacterium]|jgi:hypothetical protein|nr:hypothetical protein [Propionibacteriaceae bacterium]